MQLKPKLDKLKKRYRKSTKPQKTATWILVVLLLGLSAYGIARLLDMKKFRDIESTEAAITSAFVAELGAGVQTQEERNICFMRSAGPFDNGRLWCQVSTAIKLNQAYTYSELGAKFAIVANRFGEVSADDGFRPSWSVEVVNDVHCDLTYKPKELRKYGSAVYDVVTIRESDVAAISCAAPALQAHYQTPDEYQLSR